MKMFGLKKRDKGLTATEIMEKNDQTWKKFNAARYVSADYAELLRWLEVIPAGVSIRRVRPRDGGNMWAVAYHDSPSYYGQTLAQAFKVMQKSCTTIQDQLNVVTLAFVKGDRTND